MQRTLANTNKKEHKNLCVLSLQAGRGAVEVKHFVSQFSPLKSHLVKTHRRKQAKSLQIISARAAAMKVHTLAHLLTVTTQKDG